MNKELHYFSKSSLLIFVFFPLIAGLINAGLSQYTKVIQTPLFLDSIFTAALTLVYGLIPGLLTALWTHFFMEVFNQFNGECYPWVVVSFGTVISMQIIRKYSKKLNLAVFLNATLMTTLINALLGAAVAVVLFGGITKHPSDSFVTGFLMLGQSIVSASFWGRIPINLIDKGIAVAGAFGFYYLIHYMNKTKAVNV